MQQLILDNMFNDAIQALTLFSSLPESWSRVIINMSSSMTKEKLRMNDNLYLILGEEIRRNSLGTSSSLAALHIESRDRLVNRDSKNSGRSKSRGKGIAVLDNSMEPSMVCSGASFHSAFQQILMSGF